MRRNSKSRFLLIKDDMILNGDEIEKTLEQGVLLNAKQEKISAGSIDLHLSSDFLTLMGNEIIDLTKNEAPSYVKVERNQEGKIEFKPGMCLLASTIEVFNIPNDLCADVILRSSAGRDFINHIKSGWVDAGFNNSNLTLEFINHSSNTYLIKEELSLVQLVFYKMKPVSIEKLYNGKYNDSNGTVGSKGVC